MGSLFGVHLAARMSSRVAQRLYSKGCSSGLQARSALPLTVLIVAHEMGLHEVEGMSMTAC